MKKVLQSYALRLLRNAIYLALRLLFSINIHHDRPINTLAPSKKKYFNVLLITESPSYAEKLGWFRSDTFADCEISFRPRSESNAKHHIQLTTQYSLVRRFSGLSATNNPALATRPYKVSLLVSDKKLLPLHLLRHDIYCFLFLTYKNLFYSNHQQPYLSSTKIYEKSQISVVVENSDSPYYTSEKIYDAFRAGCYVIYIGCCDLEQYGFNKFGYNQISPHQPNLLDSIQFSIQNVDISCPKVQYACSLNQKITDDLLTFHRDSLLSNLILFLWLGKQYGLISSRLWWLTSNEN